MPLAHIENNKITQKISDTQAPLEWPFLSLKGVKFYCTGLA